MCTTDEKGYDKLKAIKNDDDKQTINIGKQKNKAFLEKFIKDVEKLRKAEGKQDTEKPFDNMEKVRHIPNFRIFLVNS